MCQQGFSGVAGAWLQTCLATRHLCCSWNRSLCRCHCRHAAMNLPHSGPQLHNTTQCLPLLLRMRSTPVRCAGAASHARDTRQTKTLPLPAHLTMLGCWKAIISDTSSSTAAAVVPLCSITLTATSMPFQRPRYTLPKDPAPMKSPAGCSRRVCIRTGPSQPAGAHIATTYLAGKGRYAYSRSRG